MAMSRRRVRASPMTRSGLLIVVSVMLLLAGSAVIGWAATHQRHAPQPTAAAAGTIPGTVGGAGPSPPDMAPAGPSPGVTAPPAVADAAPAFLPRSLPTSIRVPAIGVTSTLLQLGLAADGTLLAPAPGPDSNKAAWFTGSATPGEYGPAVIEGHVDTAAQGPSVFFRLGALVPGDKVEVARADGVTAEFIVDAVRRYPKSDFPTEAVYGGSGRAELRLITCAAFNKRIGHYTDNLVIFASLTASRS